MYHLPGIELQQRIHLNAANENCSIKNLAFELVGLEAPGEGKKIVEEKFDDWHNWEDQVVSMGR